MRFSLSNLLITNLHIIEIQSLSQYTFEHILDWFEEREAADEDDEERHDLVVVAAEEGNVLDGLVEGTEGRAERGLGIGEVDLVE